MKTAHSIGAVLAGLVFIVVSHTATDFVLESFEVFPPSSEGLHVSWMLALALGYRTILSVLGCYSTAKLAPQNGMFHALVVGMIGLAVSVAGAIVAITLNLADTWYPIALAVLTLPCAWLGGRIAGEN